MRVLAGIVLLACAASIGASTAQGATALPPDFRETVVLSGLDYPTAVSFSPDGRVFVAEKSGRVLVFSGLDDSTPTLFADLSTTVYSLWDRGLLGLALDPDFPESPYVYVSYTHDAEIGGTAPLWGSVGVLSDPCPSPPGATADGCVVSGRVSRLEADGDAMTGSEQVLVEDWCQQYPSHSVGDLAFGADGALYASGGEGSNFFALDYGQFGYPDKNPCGDPPVPVGGEQTLPTAEGGALRSQDLRTSGDPVGLSGTVIRVDPATGDALPDNPLSLSPDENARRVVAYGLRNPFRIAVRPGTNDLWVVDVGSDKFEEIDRVPTPADASVENFGWPCYEGPGPQIGYESLGLDLCEELYAEGADEAFFQYDHGHQVVPGDSCPLGSSSLSGLAFYEGGDYPGYDGALFFADYTRRCIWALRSGADGVPDPDSRVAFAVDAGDPVDLELGPGGDLYYVDFNGGAVRRIEYTGDNAPPDAVATATPASGLTPLLVQFDATGSTDVDPGDTLAFAWDLDGDGSLDDSTDAQPTWEYTVRGTYSVTLRVTDSRGATSRDHLLVNAGNSPPQPAIDLPAAGTLWRVGDTISFAGGAQDADEGALAPSRLEWSLLLHHCPAGCHVHALRNFSGVASGSFVAPDHSFPSHLELRLTAADSEGGRGVTSLVLHPRTVPLTFATQPPGLRLVFGSGEAVAPFTQAAIVGSTSTITAPSPQVVDGTPFSFSAWSDGGARSHEVVAPAVAATYTATFAAPPPPPLPPPAPPVSSPPAPPPQAAPPPPVKPCVVPRVVGLRLVAATRALAASRCALGRVSRAYSRTVRAGRVLAQAPRPRTRLPNRGKVRLVLSRGRER